LSFLGPAPISAGIEKERPLTDQKAKPYVKLASTLVLVGMGIFALERYGLSQFKTSHLDGTLMSILVLTPLVLVASGAIVFVVGRMRRL
jgi:hypothetical protein